MPENSYIFLPQYIMWDEMISNMLDTRVNRYSDQQKSFLFNKPIHKHIHVMRFGYISQTINPLNDNTCIFFCLVIKKD